jgi:uncharacterized repeat protein (TIGR02059 family)
MRGILIAIFLSISSVISASHYYVKNTGSDSYTGLSDAQAWATISKVNSRTFAAGDTISFNKGDTWRETLVIPSSGTADSYIIFNSYGSGLNPRILGSAKATTWTETSSGSHIWKSATTFSINPYTANQSEIFFENTDGTKSWGTYASGTSGLTSEYKWTWVSSNIYVYSTSDPGSAYTSVEIPQRESAVNTNRKNYFGLDGIDMFFTYWSGVGYDVTHYDMTNQHGLLIANCEIGLIGAWDDNIEQGYGIESVYSDMVVRNNRIHDCGRRGFAIDIYGSGFTASNILVELNEFYGGFHTTGCDIDVGAGYNGNLDNVVIRRNFFHEPDNSYASGPSNLIFIQNNNTAVCTLTNIYIYNNIFKWQFGYGILMEGAQSVYIYHNTFYEKSTACPPSAAYVAVQSNSHATVENNIFYSGSSTTGLEKATNYVTNDYNLYYNSTISTGSETHGVFSKNPLFKSTTDYSLQATSPAIGAGTPISAVKTDYRDSLRSTTAPTIGAFEYTGAIPNPTIPVYSSSVIENATPSLIEITYSLSLANIIPATSAFKVTVNSVARTVNSVSVSGSLVSLTLSSAVVFGDVVYVSYTAPASNPLQTSSGGLAASFSNALVTNNVLPVSPAYVSSSIENATPSLLTMVYSLTLANKIPATSAFIVRVNSVVRTISSISISGTKVLLNLASPVIYSDVVTVTYTKPSTNPLQTIDGGLAASITNKPVTNNVLPPSPVYVSSVIENATPSTLTMTYSLTLKNVVPATTSFTVTVNSINRGVNPVAISGTKVILTLASPVAAGDVVTVAYTKPSANPLQTPAGGLAATISAQPVTNNVGEINNLPVIVSDYETTVYSGFVYTIDASGSYDLDKDNLSFSWITPANIAVSSTTTSKIQFLAPIVTTRTTLNFILNLSDGKGIQSLNMPIVILPFMDGLDEATVTKASALSYLAPDVPSNVFDGNLTTQWSGLGDGNWITMKLKKPFKISYVQVAFPASQPGSSIFDVYASADSLIWDDVLNTVTSCSFSGNYQIFEFPSMYSSTEYSFIKVIGHGNTADKWNYITEFKIFGYPHGGSLEDDIFKFSVYPNPSADLVIVSFETPTLSNQRMLVVNQAGQISQDIAIEPGTYTQQIPLTVKSGFYILQLVSNNIVVGAQKLIVVR